MTKHLIRDKIDKCMAKISQARREGRVGHAAASHIIPPVSGCKTGGIATALQFCCNKTRARGWIVDSPDTGGLERAQEDVSDELGHCGGSEVDRGLVLPRGALAQDAGGLDLEKLDTTELEPTCVSSAESIQFS